MRDFFIAQLDRRDFGALLSTDGISRLRPEPSYGLERFQVRADKSIIAAWNKDPRRSGELPSFLVCAAGTEGDWAAWITTFAAKIRPFTAYTRLLSDEGLRELSVEYKQPDLGPLLWPVAGLILGEVLSSLRLQDRALDSVSGSTCASTLSFALFRAAACYKHFERWQLVVDAWDAVRHMTRQRSRGISAVPIARVCFIVLFASGQRSAERFLSSDDRVIAEILNDFLTSMVSRPRVLFEISGFAETEERMHGSREDRVIAFEKFRSALRASNLRPTEINSFAIGYLASRIAPGTIRHSELLAQISREYPTAILWYAFFAGIGESGYVSDLGRRGVELPASVWRIARDLLRPESPFESPTSDISLLELVALSRSSADPLENLITTTQASAVIEILPCVSTLVNTVTRSDVADQGASSARKRRVLASLGNQIERLRETYRELIDDSEVKTEQETLFPIGKRKSK